MLERGGRILGETCSELTAGDVITVGDAEGDVALAFVDPDSPIRARIVAAPGTALDAAWTRRRS